MSRTSTLHGHPTASALNVAAFLADRPVPPTGHSDAWQRTHTQLRCTGLEGDRVHRLDSDRPRTFYVTGCGERVAKADSVRTGAPIDCRHQGCRTRYQA